MKADPKKYSLFEYESKDIDNNYFELGDIVINDRNEIGVVIQLYEKSEGDLRADMFGNYPADRLRLATDQEIMDLRPELLFRYKFLCKMSLESRYSNSFSEAMQIAQNLEADIYDLETDKIIFQVQDNLRDVISL